MGTEDLCPVPPAAVRHGRARQNSGTGAWGDCSRYLWVSGPRGQYLGNIRFIENPGYKNRGLAMWAKHSSYPPGSLPRSQSSGTRDIVRVVVIVAPFAPWGVREKFI